MPTRRMDYYTQLGRDLNLGMSNLASVFGPQSPQQVAAGVAATTARNKDARAQTAFDAITAPGSDQDARDRYGIAAGLFNPTQSYSAQNQNDATRQRGQDIGLQGTLGAAGIAADAARYGHDLTHERGLAGLNIERQGLDDDLITDIFGPANIPQGNTRTGISPQGAALLSDRLGTNIWATPDTPGMAPNRTPEEAAGARLGERPELITDDILTNMLLSDLDTQNYIDPATTRPRIGLPSDFIGQEPYVPDTTRSAMRPVMLVDETTNQRVPGMFNPNPGGGYLLGDGETPAPPNLVPYDPPKLEGGTGDVSPLRPPVESGQQEQIIAAEDALRTIGRVEDIIRANPGAQGIVGTLRGTAQDIIQTGGELGTLFGRGAEQSRQEVASMLGPELAGEMFDPSIPALSMLYNLLAWQYAKGMSGSRVSNEQLQMAREAIGSQGLFANQAASLARLSELRAQMESQLGASRGRLGAGGLDVNGPMTVQTPQGAVTIRPLD